MALEDKLKKDVDTILMQRWNVRGATRVPTTDTLALAGGGARFEATILYADLADSTELAMKYDKRVAAKVFKSFLVCSSKIIRVRGGHIRSFDGDRVMGVFIGKSKNSDAVKAALNINYAFRNIIKPALEPFASLNKGSYRLAYGVGIDTSDVLVVRGGIRKHNDLVWIGRAPNVAAKLSSVRTVRYPLYITKQVFSHLDHEAKFDARGKDRWALHPWGKVDGINKVYRSSQTLVL
jgi:adenylate cyclase